MATPVTAAAAIYETYKVVSGDVAFEVQAGPLVAGMLASMVAGFVAIAGLIRFLRTRSTNVFIAYRIVLAAVVLIAWLG